MTILQIGPYPLSPSCIHGGVESSVFGLANELAKTQNVYVFDLPRIGGVDAREKISDNLTIFRFCNDGRHNQDAVKRVNTYIEKIQELHPDVCHIHGTGAISNEIHKRLTSLGVKSIVTVHGLLSVEKRNALKKHFSLKSLYQYVFQTKDERAMLNRCSEIIVDTQYVAEALKKYHLKHLPKVHVIPQGIDSRFFDIKCSKDSNLILSVGAFSPRKGHLLLLQAFDELCGRGVDARLLIVGTCADEGYYRRMQEYASQSPNKERIEIKANVSKEEIDEAYRAAGIFALHSQEESQGIVFAEAMATGLPVVATKVGGVPYVVEDGKTGLLSDYGNVSAFADNMEKLIASSESRSRFSQNAVEVAKRYSWEDIGKTVSIVTYS